ncbi:hypothetical protein CAPTEDRAFT_190410 [Capitella teleta]|uniref:Glutathione S-transferase omega n=1 Tax=Capitella teleta TaxID=283909 RepID=R7TEW4_CAPTE|nr:hypothetical protein CAPTEDRAFT_190410 [Capitella teleta]|eukprot:ELT89606.1 hypothetical protein CAPTEDRAFT_190410 [Capitella teleta]
MSTSVCVKPKLYSAWFCPFAQRAWMALVHKGVDFEYVEQDPYDKTAEWLAINPRGLVPTIHHKGKSIYESSVCIEFVDEQWPTSDPETSLLPKDPLDRAYARIWGDFVGKKIVTLYYRLLMSQNPAEHPELQATILKNITDLQEAMSNDGPFFAGQHLGFVDVMLAPFAQRFGKVMKHFRQFEIPDDAKFERYHEWWAAVKETKSFRGTQQEEEKLIASYERYAVGTAKTEVADAIRKGHQLP